MNSNQNTEISVLWPGGSNAVPQIIPASRPNSLNHTTIAFVWDYMFRGDEIFPMLEKLISKEYTHVSFIHYDQFGSTFGGDDHEALHSLPAKLQKHGVTAVISGIGC